MADRADGAYSEKGKCCPSVNRSERSIEQVRSVKNSLSVLSLSFQNLQTGPNEIPVGEQAPHDQGRKSSDRAYQVKRHNGDKEYGEYANNLDGGGDGDRFCLFVIYQQGSLEGNEHC